MSIAYSLDVHAHATRLPLSALSPIGIKLFKALIQSLNSRPQADASHVLSGVATALMQAQHIP